MKPMPTFKIRCSAIHLIMGRIGLTDAQEKTLEELQNKPKLTDKQQETLNDLIEKKQNPSLPATLTSYLKKWYAEKVFDYRDDAGSKHTQKGDWCEADAIEMIASRFNLFGIEKNDLFIDSEYLIGTPDLIVSKIGATIDTKCPWDARTYLDHVLSDLSEEYFWQGQGYMALTGMTKHHVAFCLIDTPDECNYGNHVEFDALDNERIHIKTIDFDESKINQVYSRVQLCRKWLETYDYSVRKALN